MDFGLNHRQSPPSSVVFNQVVETNSWNCQSNEARASRPMLYPIQILWE